MRVLLRARAPKAFSVAAALAIAATALLLSCAQDSPRDAAVRDEPPSLLLVTIDTLRPDRLGCCGNPKTRTPYLDALARSGVLFETAVASAPSTAPSHTTIMTAKSPRAHGVFANGQPLAPNATTLAERLLAEGYSTAAVVSSYVLAPRIGLNRGFGEYMLAYKAPGKTETASAESTCTRAISWLREHARGRFFLWVHLYDPHQPYDAPGIAGKFADPEYNGSFKTWQENQVNFWNRTGIIPPKEARHLAARYDAEVNYVDVQIGRLLEALDETGARENTLVCVTADHGETLGEHAGYFGHVHQLYETTLRVPLIFSGPGAPSDVPARHIVARPARLLDLAPTCLDLLGFPPMEGVEGRSLVPFDRSRDSRDASSTARVASDYTVSETGPSERQTPEAQSVPRMLAARTPKSKLVRWLERDSLEVFDLTTDPGETRNLAGTSRETESELAAILTLWEQAIGGAPALEALDDETREQLRSLGYID